MKGAKSCLVTHMLLLISANSAVSIMEPPLNRKYVVLGLAVYHDGIIITPRSSASQFPSRGSLTDRVHTHDLRVSRFSRDKWNFAQSGVVFKERGIGSTEKNAAITCTRSNKYSSAF